MFQTILTAIFTFIATSIDYFFILLILFAIDRYRHKVSGILLGEYLGTSVLIGVSLLAAYGVRSIPQPWIVGLLGLIPIGLGIKMIFKREEEEAEEVLESAEKYKGVVMSLTFLTIASGGDNLGIYIPLFASLNSMDTLMTVSVLFISTAVLNLVCYKIAGIREIGEIVERYERILVPVIFIGIGLMVLVENGSIDKLLSLF